MTTLKSPRPKRAEMMSVCYPKPDASDPGKTRWITVGVAWPQPGGKIKVRLDAIPINFSGELVLFPETQKQES